nr:immunoglobulin heavy chain junction region [Mus musculus]MBK4184647.1 immunoglobulin heavy chain junction region [Mus musculus]MBK4184650.1 immunoglobulin heavy chain junction region [Mus musculus]
CARSYSNYAMDYW